jgi:hypothetical protein
MDLDSTLQEYQIQLEQVSVGCLDFAFDKSEFLDCLVFKVEFALKNDQENQELLKLKFDLEEVIKLTQDLINETADKDTEPKQSWKSQKKDDSAYSNSTTDKMVIPKQIRWKPFDKCMAIWKDGK